MLGIIVSRADSASVHIGEQLLALEDWAEHEDDSLPDAEGGGAVYRTDGACLREFEQRHLDLHRPADAFEEPTLVVFASRHAGETGPLLTAHHTGNFGPADHGGSDNDLAKACPNAHDRVLAALAEHAPEGYEAGMECTHHGPSEVGAPSMFVEVGSSEPEWEDPDAARAVAAAILDLRDTDPYRDPESPDKITLEGNNNESDEFRRHLVGLGGGHYAPRFERVARETDWPFGHVGADWGLEALDEAHRETVLTQAFEQSRAGYALVDGDRESLEAAVEQLGYRAVSETWVRETSGVDLAFVQAVEAELETIDGGLRFGEPVKRANDYDSFEGNKNEDDWTVTSLPTELLEETFGIDRDATREAVAETCLAFTTAEGGTRPTGDVVVADAGDRETVIEGLVAVLTQRYDSVERNGDELVAREKAFDPERARTLGVPEGPAFGKLSNGQAVEVDGEVIPPEVVQTEREQRFPL